MNFIFKCQEILENLLQIIAGGILPRHHLNNFKILPMWFIGKKCAPADVAQWIEDQPENQRVAGSIPT